MFLTLINLILSPFNLLFFIFFASTKANSTRYFVSTSTNVSRLKVIPYGLYNLAFVLSVLALTYAAALLFPDKIILWEIYQPRHYWLSILGWIVSIFTLSVYFKGMEGNIMGFIFFPMLLFSSLAIILGNILSFFSISFNFSDPGFDFGFLPYLAFHVFLPSYMLMFIYTEKKRETGSVDLINPISKSINIQLIFFCINWVIVKLFGNGLSFSYFFGKGQPLIYFIPMMGGALYFLIFIFSQSAKNKWKEIVDLVAMIMAVILMFLQLYNYYNLMRQCF